MRSGERPTHDRRGIDLNELSLFTGIGGGLLGTKLLGWNHIGYVEWDEYCCKVLEQRIKDGMLDDAPIWQVDIREFNRRYAEKYRGLVDIVTAGFPCQPFSFTGKRKAAADDRNMWPETKESIDIIGPDLVFLENVPGLLSHEYALTIFNDLSEIGYQSLPPLRLGADDIGANHRRKRIWILAYNDSGGRWSMREQRGVAEIRTERSNESMEIAEFCQDVADTTGKRSHPKKDEQIAERTGGNKLQPVQSRNNWCNWWSVEPAVGRLAYGVPNRVDRPRAIGNAQVPAVVATVWKLLTEGD